MNKEKLNKKEIQDYISKLEMMLEVEEVKEIKNTDDTLFNLKELAEFLNITYSRARNTISKSDIPKINVGRYNLYRKSSVIKWLREKEKASIETKTKKSDKKRG